MTAHAMPAPQVTFMLTTHGDPSQLPTLPVQLLDDQGRELQRLAMTPASPVTATVGDGATYAALRLPSGRAMIKPLLVDGSRVSFLQFDVGRESPHEWMAWSAARVDLQRPVAPLIDAPGMRDAWVQLWEMGQGTGPVWTLLDLPGQGLLHGSEGTQLTLDPASRPRAVLAYMGKGVAQVIPLPPSRRVSVLLTRAHAHALDDAPRVLVGGYGPLAEGVLEFLRQGALALAGAVDPGGEIANQLLFDKIEDPIAATASAYYLLRKRDWDRMPQAWLENLANWYDNIPDAVLLRDAAAIQRGMAPSAAANVAARSLQEMLARGLPLFAEARWVLEELLSYAQTVAGEPGALAACARVRRMLGAFVPAGLTFGFNGTAPDTPVSEGEAGAQLEALAIPFDPGSPAWYRLPASTRFIVNPADTGAGPSYRGVGEPVEPAADGRTLFLRDIYAKN